MARAWRLTRHAEATLAEIAAWTVETFGRRQAEAYEQDLIDRCGAIAEGSVVSQDCSLLLARPGADRLRFARSGRHFIVYLDGPDRIVVLDFLHARSNLPVQLARLAGN